MAWSKLLFSDFVAIAKRNQDKVKEQLALLESSDKELEAVERGMALELKETLNEIGRKFKLLKEFIKEKESACLRRAREASQSQIRTVRGWRKRNKRLIAKGADVSA